MHQTVDISAQNYVAYMYHVQPEDQYQLQAQPPLFFPCIISFYSRYQLPA